MTMEDGGANREDGHAFLMRLNAALKPLSDPAAVKETATLLLGQWLKASRVAYFEIAGESYVIEGDFADGVPHMMGRHAINDFGPRIYEAMLRGETVLSEDTETDTEISGSERQSFKAAQIRAYIGAPLIKEGKLVAGLTIHSAQPRHWRDGEIEVVQEVVERSWAAVEKGIAEVALRASEEKYRTLFQSIDEGFCVIEIIFDAKGKPVDYLFIEQNAAFERQTGLKGVMGKTARQLVPDLEQWWIDRYGHVAKSGESARFEHGSAAMGRWFEVYASRIGGAPSHRVAIVFNDITARKRAEMALHSSERRYRELANSQPQIVWQTDAEGTLQYVNDRFSEVTGLPASMVIGKPWLFPVQESDERRMEAAWEIATRTKSVYEAELRVVLPNGDIKWFLSRGKPVKGEDGEIAHWVGVEIDFTERKRAEQQTRVLMREVNHRSKNLLTVVQAIARQMAPGLEPGDFAERLGERLRGLAASQDLLVKNEWQGVDISELIRSQLAHLEDIFNARIKLSGEPLLLSAAAAQNLGLVLHELGTNAGKYGSLSGETGTLAVSWRREARKGEDCLIIDWRERGGPKVTAPKRRGFGTVLLTKVAERSFAGKVKLEYLANGLHWRLFAPVENFLARGEE